MELRVNNPEKGSLQGNFWKTLWEKEKVFSALLKINFTTRASLNTSILSSKVFHLDTSATCHFLTLSQKTNFRLIPTERVCRQQFQI